MISQDFESIAAKIERMVEFGEVLTPTTKETLLASIEAARDDLCTLEHTTMALGATSSKVNGLITVLNGGVFLASLVGQFKEVAHDTAKLERREFKLRVNGMKLKVAASGMVH